MWVGLWQLSMGWACRQVCGVVRVCAEVRVSWVRRQVSSESVCSFGSELGRTEQAMCDMCDACGSGRGLGGGEEQAQVSQDGPSVEYGLDLKASAHLCVGVHQGWVLRCY